MEEMCLCDCLVKGSDSTLRGTQCLAASPSSFRGMLAGDSALACSSGVMLSQASGGGATAGPQICPMI